MIEFIRESDFKVNNGEELSLWIKQVINEEHKTIREITYIFCTDVALHEINLKYLDHDTLTDIITFDYTIKDSIAGEIYISTDRIKENAEIFGVPFNTELERVIIHGILHLCGYKDKSVRDKEVMRGKEDLYMSRLSELRDKL